MAEKNTSTLIFGAGFSGRQYGRMLVAEGREVHGTTRSPDKAEQLRAEGITPHIFDGDDADDTLRDALAASTDLVISIAPDDEGDPVLRALADEIAAMKRLQWIAYLSTVGVYGDHEGEWVTEDTDCKPVSKRSLQRVDAERAWTKFAHDLGAPLSILRLSGIYGPGRNAFVKLEKGTAKRIVKPGQVFNRIHVEDIARAASLLADQRAAGIYNVSDDEPAPPQDVVAFAASLMKVDPPPEIDFDDATLSPMARSFYGERRRVSNKKLKQAGFTFTYADYRRGLEVMWEQGNWQ